MQRVNNIDFDMEHPEYDLIGTVYMILMGLFASDAGKKGGEFSHRSDRANYVLNWLHMD